MTIQSRVKQLVTLSKLFSEYYLKEITDLKTHIEENCITEDDKQDFEGELKFLLSEYYDILNKTAINLSDSRTRMLEVTSKNVRSNKQEC